MSNADKIFDEIIGAPKVRNPELRQMIEERMAKGGLLKKAMQVAKDVLPAPERKANLEKMLEGSAVKQRLYHGTDKDIPYFKTMRPTYWFSEDPELANQFVAGGRRAMGSKPKKGSAVYPVHANVKNPLDLTQLPASSPLVPQSAMSGLELLEKAGADVSPDNVRKLAEWDVELNKSLGGGYAPDIDPVASEIDRLNYKVPLYSLLDNHLIIKGLKDAGYDSVKLLERFGQGKKPTKEAVTIGVFDPTNIKSAVGNVGTYDLSVPDLTKKEGGAVMMSKGGMLKKAAKAVKSMVEDEPNVSRIDMDYKDVTKRVPQLTEAAQKLKGGELTAAEYEEMVRRFKPVEPYAFVPQPATQEDAMRALRGKQKEKYGKTGEIPAGTQTGLRLDIPAYQNHGVWINSIHPEGMPTHYGPVSSVKNVTMSGSPEQAFRVATGESAKGPWARIQGEWNPITEEEAVARAKEYLDHPEWAQIGYDPERHGYFYDRRTMEPILGAEEVIQIGPLVLGKKPRYGSKSEEKYAEGGAIGKNVGRGMAGLTRSRQPLDPSEIQAQMLDVPASIGVPFAEAGAEYLRGNLEDAKLAAAIDTVLTGVPAAAVVAKPAYRAVKSGIQKAAPAAGEAVRGALESAMESGAIMDPRMAVVKPTGGQWLDTGRPMLRPRHGENLMMSDSSEGATRDKALINWRDKQLSNYVRTQMSTPDDPILKLAEEWPAKRAAMLDEKRARLDTLESKRQAIETGPVPPEVRDPDAWRQARMRTIDGEMATVREDMDNINEMSPLHMPMQDIGLLSDTAMRRTAAGFPHTGIAKSDFGRMWENLSDRQIKNIDAWKLASEEYLPKITGAERENITAAFRPGRQMAEPPNPWLTPKQAQEARHFGQDPDFSRQVIEQNPWLSKVDPGAQVYGLMNSDQVMGNLGFNHIMDVLRSDMRRGDLKPEDLSRLSVTDAVKRTSRYDAEKAAQMARAEATSAANLTPHREFGGYRMVQLDKPGQFSKESQIMGHSVEGYEPPSSHPDWIEDAAHEGSSSYGHGGWEAIKSGDAQVLSFRDTKNRPHATVEISKAGRGADPQRWLKTASPEEAAELERRMSTLESTGDYADPQFRRMVAASAGYRDETGKWVNQPMPGYVEWTKTQPGIITQIKGKRNGPVNEDYWPYLQRYVRESGTEVTDDLDKIGMVDVTAGYGPRIAFLPDNMPRYVTRDELERFKKTNEFTPDPHFSDPKFGPKGMKRGGYVTKSIPEFAKGGIVKMIKGAVEGATSAKGNIQKYADPESKHIADWQWKPMGEVAEAVNVPEVPDYIQKGFGNFMADQVKRAQKGDIGARDLIKAYTITRSSVNRGGLSHASATKTGMKLPKTDERVRPEGAFSEWLGSPEGQRYLDAAERGEIDPRVLKDLQEKFSPFGMPNVLADDMRWAAENLSGSSMDVPAMILGGPERYRELSQSVPGIGPAKSGFMGAMLGRGDFPTLDARQLRLNTEGGGKEAAKFMKRGKGEGGEEAVARLAARQNALDMALDPSLDPFYQHLVHHTIWDRVGGDKTTHDDLVRAMRGYAGGGTVSKAGMVKKAASLIEEAFKGDMDAAGRAAAGREAAKYIKSQSQVKPSEAFGQLMEKGFKKTVTTQADRTRVGGGNIGGASFSALSAVDPNYAGKVWGVGEATTAARLANLSTPETAWTTMLGSATQLKTNPIVFDKLKREFRAAMKEGKLSPELEAKINKNLALTFGEGADIRDPGIWKQADTFEKRAALADIMMGQGIPPSKGGVSLGGEKSGKGVIFRPTDILKAETEPGLLHPEHGGDVPTFAAGPRLFSLEKEFMYRPDLHPGFPVLMKGEDLGYNVMPTPTEVFLPDWHRRFKEMNPERQGPGYYDLALGVKGEGLPSQEFSDAYIRHLIREGFKAGGPVKKMKKRSKNG